MEAEFLSEQLLTSRIGEVVGGGNLRCAVAYWGSGAVKHLFGPDGLPADAMIVCDILGGSTDPAELVKMGAPANPKLKHLDNLHAKVYISDRGAVICSANASQNGIGFDREAGTIEAGIFVAPGTKAYKEATDWFGKTWAPPAEPINPSVLEAATTAWNNRPRGRIGRLPLALPKGRPSLLAAVAADPKNFEGIGFVFTSSEADLEELDPAIKALLREDDALDHKLISENDRPALQKWDRDDLYTGWPRQQVAVWPQHFVSIHRYRGQIIYSFYERVHVTNVTETAENRGVVFGRRLERLQLPNGFLTDADAMLENDRALLKRLLDYCGQQDLWFYKDSERLLDLIEKVSVA